MSKRKQRLQMQRRKRSHLKNLDYDMLVKRYLPGANRQVMIPVDCSQEEFEVWTFQAWVNGRDIPIEALCILFRCDQATIRRWQAVKPLIDTSV